MPPPRPPPDDRSAHPPPVRPGSRAAVAAASGRDVRIDLLRGLALWMIFVDHIPGNVLRLVTYHRIGYSDAAEIFIFLSGISCSLAYGRLARSDFPAAQRRALRRVLEIYLGYLLVAAPTFALVLYYRDALGAQYLAVNDLGLLIDQPSRAFAAAVFLRYTPQYLDILPLYMALVAAAPALTRALRRAPAATLGLSAALWAMAALLPGLRPPNLVPASFNPLSWQFLFCIGLWAGGHYLAAGRSFRAARGGALACGLVIIANLMARTLYDFGRGPGHFHIVLLDELQAASRGGNEGVPRLTHFLAVAYLFAAFGWRRDAAALKRAWARPLVWCGQHSLEVFCMGVVLGDVIAVYFRTMQPGVGYQLLADGAGVAAMVLLARSLTLRQRQRLTPAEVHPDLARPG